MLWKRSAILLCAISLAYAFAGTVAAQQPAAPPAQPAGPGPALHAPGPAIKRVKLSNGLTVVVTDRGVMRRAMARLNRARITAAAPAVQVQLPVDWTKGNTLSFPQLGNVGPDAVGDCMLCMVLHCDQTLTGNVATESAYALQDAVNFYFSLTGGADKGLNEQQVLSAYESKAGLLNNPLAVAFDAIDIDPTDIQQMQQCIYLFENVCFMLSVPDPWLSVPLDGTGVWDGPALADSANGHGVLINGVGTDGSYTVQTWGTHVKLTQRGVRDCDPGAFVVASLRQFNPQGYAANGMHYTQLAPLWVSLGGNPWPASPFPPPSSPPVIPPPVGPTPVAPPPTGNLLTITTALQPGTYQIGAPPTPAGTVLSATDQTTLQTAAAGIQGIVAGASGNPSAAAIVPAAPLPDTSGQCWMILDDRTQHANYTSAQLAMLGDKPYWNRLLGQRWTVIDASQPVFPTYAAWLRYSGVSLPAVAIVDPKTAWSTTTNVSAVIPLPTDENSAAVVAAKYSRK